MFQFLWSEMQARQNAVIWGFNELTDFIAMHPLQMRQKTQLVQLYWKHSPKLNCSAINTCALTSMLAKHAGPRLYIDASAEVRHWLLLPILNNVISMGGRQKQGMLELVVVFLSHNNATSGRTWVASLANCCKLQIKQQFGIMLRKLHISSVKASAECFLLLRDEWTHPDLIECENPIKKVLVIWSPA